MSEKNEDKPSKEEQFEKKCFFITPIGNKDSEEFSKLEGITDNVIKPVLNEIGLVLEVAHSIDSIGSITDQIFESIVRSKLVIVNLTGLNPNVMYELAVRHSFGKACVIICEDSTNLPFDILADRTIFFEDSIKGSGELKIELSKKIKASLSEENDNPVTRAIGRAEIMNTSTVENTPYKLILSEIESLSKKVDRIDNDKNNRIRFSNLENFNKDGNYLSSDNVKVDFKNIQEIIEDTNSKNASLKINTKIKR